jgi:hypothetical protein
MNIFNLTPHPIHIVDAEGNVTETIPNCGWELRLATTTEEVGEFAGVKLTKTVFGEPVAVQGKSFDGQPNPWEGKIQLDTTKFVVSQLVKNKYAGTPTDNLLLVPAEVVRDGNGNILGCKSLGI